MSDKQLVLYAELRAAVLKVDGLAQQATVMNVHPLIAKEHELKKLSAAMSACLASLDQSLNSKT